ncbi:MAG: PilN domain-containing protein [Steroidobacteraceae bacterium]
MPRINLLPWREAQRTERKKAFGVGMLAAGLAAAAVTGVGFLLFNQMINAQQVRNDKLREEIKTLDKQIEEINSLELRKQQFIARMQIIEKLQQSRPEIVHVFDTFVKTIPDGTYLTAITQTERNFKLQGVAQSASRVSNFIQSLSESEWLQEPELENVAITKPPTIGQEFWMLTKQRVSAADEAEAAKAATAKRNKP